MAQSDVLVTCTGAVGAVVTLADTHRALARQGREADRPLVICDLGLPRDVEAAVAGLPGVTCSTWRRCSATRPPAPPRPTPTPPAEIVASELASYLAGQRLAEVTPTVTALRQRAADVVEAELLRLDSRLPGLEDPQRDEVARTVRRVVDKLLHAPTVRVKQFASTPGGDQYAAALRELFELRPGAAEAVAAPIDLGRIHQRPRCLRKDASGDEHRRCPVAGRRAEHRLADRRHHPHPADRHPRQPARHDAGRDRPGCADRRGSPGRAGDHQDQG